MVQSNPALSQGVAQVKFILTARKHSADTVTAGPTNQPQPIIFDPISNLKFPSNLSDPDNVPSHTADPLFFPPAMANLTDTAARTMVSAAIAEISRILDQDSFKTSGNCSKCIASLSIGQTVARMAPTYLPEAIISLCEATRYKSHKECREIYAASSFGAPWTQVLAYADVHGLDGQYICSYLSSDFCPRPELSIPTEVKFPKLRPNNPAKPSPRGNRIKVLHFSDLHLGERAFFVELLPSLTQTTAPRHSVQDWVGSQLYIWDVL